MLTVALRAMVSMYVQISLPPESFAVDSHTGQNNSNDFGLNTNTMVLFAFVVVVAFVLGWGYILLARQFTKVFIWVTGILHIVFGFVTAICESEECVGRHQYSDTFA